MPIINENDRVYCGLCQMETKRVSALDADTFKCPQCLSVYERVTFTPPGATRHIWMLKTPGPNVIRYDQKHGEVTPVPTRHVSRETEFETYKRYAEDQMNRAQVAQKSVAESMPRIKVVVPRETNSHDPGFVLQSETEMWLQQVFHPGRVDSTRDRLDEAVKLLERWHTLSQKQD